MSEKKQPYIEQDIEALAKTDEFWQERAQRFVSFDGDFKVYSPEGEDLTAPKSELPKTESLSEAKRPEFIVNPDTGNKIKFDTALKYDKETKVYKLAASYLDGDTSNDGKPTSGGSPDETPGDESDESSDEIIKQKTLKAIKTLSKSTTVVDPESKKKISLSNALHYPKDSQVYKTAKQLVDQKVQSYKIFKTYSPDKQKAILSIKAPKKQDIYTNTPSEFDPSVLELGAKAMGADLMKYHESVMDCIKKSRES